MSRNAQSRSYDVAIAYRICPRVARPALGLPFSDNKLRLAEVCLSSFRESLDDLRVKVWALLDDCPSEYEDLFRKYFTPDCLELVRLPGIGNTLTFAKQIDILLTQQDADLVYFAEDDYFYLPGKFHLLTEFARAFSDADFVTPYDHADCYNLELHHRPKWLRLFGNQHWRTAASTCLTFLTRQQTLRDVQEIFRRYVVHGD